MTDAGGTAGPSPTGAVRPLSIRFRPTIPAANAPTPTALDRMRNDRRDQSGISAVGRVRVGGRRRAKAPRERSRSMPRTHRPTPTEIAVEAATDRGLRQRIAERGDEPDDPEDDEGRRSDRVAAPRQQPETGPDEQRDDHDEQLEGELVVRPEEADDDVLRARRLEVDDHLSDGGDERGRAGEETGEQLRDAERRGDGQDPRERGRPVMPGGRRVRRQARGGRGLGCGAHPTIIPVRCDIRMSRVRVSAVGASCRAQARPSRHSTVIGIP